MRGRQLPAIPTVAIGLGEVAVPVLVSLRQITDPCDGFPPHSRDKVITKALTAVEDRTPNPGKAGAAHPFDALAAAVADRSVFPSFTGVLAAQRSTML